MSKRILAIDTTTEACSVALLNKGKKIVYFELSAHQHTQRILPLVKRILEEAKITLKQLDVLAFGRGPGSFTGVRISVCIAQGLALGADLPLIGISTLKIIAQSAWRLYNATNLLVAIDARIGELYWAEYKRNEQGLWLGEDSECVLKLEAAKARIATIAGTWICAGTGWQGLWPYTLLIKKHNLRMMSKVIFPCAEDMLPLAQEALLKGKILTADQAKPTYIHHENEILWKKQLS